MARADGTTDLAERIDEVIAKVRVLPGKGCVPEVLTELEGLREATREHRAQRRRTSGLYKVLDDNNLYDAPLGKEIVAVLNLYRA